MTATPTAPRKGKKCLVCGTDIDASETYCEVCKENPRYRAPKPSMQPPNPEEK